MSRPPKSGNHPRDPHRDNSAPLEELKEMGVLMGKDGNEAQDALRLMIGCMACRLRRGEPINAYGLSQCTYVGTGTTSRTCNNLVGTGFFTGYTEAPARSGPVSQRNYEFAPAVARVLRLVPSLTDCFFERPRR